MDMLFLVQPLQQSKLRLAFNLILAPLYALLSVVLPSLLMTSFASVMLANIPNLQGFLVMVLLFGMWFYLVLIYPVLLIYFLIIKYFNKFNILSIMVAAIFAILGLAYIADDQAIFSAILQFSVFTLPTIAFFIFLSIRSHEKYQAEL